MYPPLPSPDSGSGSGPDGMAHTRPGGRQDYWPGYGPAGAESRSQLRRGGAAGGRALRQGLTRGTRLPGARVALLVDKPRRGRLLLIWGPEGAAVRGCSPAPDGHSQRSLRLLAGKAVAWGLSQQLSASSARPIPSTAVAACWPRSKHSRNSGCSSLEARAPSATIRRLGSRWPPATHKPRKSGSCRTTSIRRHWARVMTACPPPWRRSSRPASRATTPKCGSWLNQIERDFSARSPHTRQCLSRRIPT